MSNPEHDPGIQGVDNRATDILAVDDPEAPASPERITALHTQIDKLIDLVPEDFVWDTLPTDHPANTAISMSNIRFLSIPGRIDERGRAIGEAFARINFFAHEQGDRQIMLTEDRGSGNPTGDVLGSIAAGAIVRRIHRYDTAFLSPTVAVVREGNFTFGPARLEQAENEAQVNNPFVPATNRHIDRINDILATGSLYAHDEEMQLPQDPACLQKLPVQMILGTHFYQGEGHE